MCYGCPYPNELLTNSNPHPHSNSNPNPNPNPIPNPNSNPIPNQGRITLSKEITEVGLLEL